MWHLPQNHEQDWSAFYGEKTPFQDLIKAELAVSCLSSFNPGDGFALVSYHLAKCLELPMSNSLEEKSLILEVKNRNPKLLPLMDLVATTTDYLCFDQLVCATCEILEQQQFMGDKILANATTLDNLSCVHKISYDYLVDFRGKLFCAETENDHGFYGLLKIDLSTAF